MGNIRIARLAAVACCTALLYGQTFSVPAVAQEDKTVTIGGLTFLTGKYGSYGQDVAAGMKLAVDHVNEDGGLLGGAKLVLDLQDTSSDAAQAVSMLRRFAGTDKIVGVVGPTGTPDLLAALPLTDRLQIPIISIGSQKALKHEQFTDWVVRVNLVETPQLIKGILDDVIQIKGNKTMALLTDRSNDFAQAESASLREAISLGSKVKIVSDESYATGDKDFAVLIDKIMRNSPEAIWLSGATQEVYLIMLQARSRGFKGYFVGGAGLNDPKIAELAGDAATGFVTFLPMNIKSKKPIVQRFATDFPKKFPDRKIATYTGYGYDSVLMMADAIKRAGSTDRAKVMKALGSTTKFVAVTGTFSYAGKGDNTSAVPYLFSMGKDGNFTPLTK